MIGRTWCDVCCDSLELSSTRHRADVASRTGDELFGANEERSLTDVRLAGRPTAPKDRPDEVGVAGEGGGGQLAGGRVVLEQLDQADVGCLVGELCQRLVTTHGDATPGPQQSLNGRHVLSLD